MSYPFLNLTLTSDVKYKLPSITHFHVVSLAKLFLIPAQLFLIIEELLNTLALIFFLDWYPAVVILYSLTTDFASLVIAF